VVGSASSTPCGAWTQVTELKGLDTVASADFDYAAAISNTTAVAGAPGFSKAAGRAYVFTNTATGWKQAAKLKVSDTTVRERRDEWIAAGVFETIANEAISGYDRIIGLDLSDVALDAGLHKSPCGGGGTGKNPTDRAKLGWKWSVLTDKVGIPFGWTADGANRNDSVLLAPTLEDAERRGLTEEIETIWLDRGYDSAATRVRLSEARIDDAVIAKKRKRGSRSSRWVCDGRSSGRTPGSPTMAS
jgi:hypothetical protein